MDRENIADRDFKMAFTVMAIIGVIALGLGIFA